MHCIGVLQKGLWLYIRQREDRSFLAKHHRLSQLMTGKSLRLLANAWIVASSRFCSINLFTSALGVTFPSGAAQLQLLREVYSDSGVDPHDVTYVEAHGTGTAAGDPQEVNSITKVFCQQPRKQALKIGSVKSNIGHTKGTAGGWIRSIKSNIGRLQWHNA